MNRPRLYGDPKRDRGSRPLRASYLAVPLACVLVGCTDPQPYEIASPPALAPPAGLVVRVASVDELYAALRELRSNTTVVLQPGRYRLTEPLRLATPDDSPMLTAVALRGGTDVRDDVRLEGGAIEIGDVDRMQIANVTFVNASQPAIHVRGEAGAARPHVYNVGFVGRAGLMLRATAAKREAGGGVAGGIVEYSVFEYPSDGDELDESAGAIAVSGGRGWIVRYNRFRNIRGGSRAPRRLRPAVMFRDGSDDTVTHNNLFIDCERAIAYGMAEADAPADHFGGAIYNNFIYRRRGFERGDAGILLWGSAGTRVYHNTVLLNGTYKRPIEYRFASTTGLDIRNNLTDGPIEARDGSQAIVVGNYMKATAGMFRNIRAGDLRLTPTATEAIDRGVQITDGPPDWNGDKRPAGLRPDIGADEYATTDNRRAPLRQQ